MYGVLPTGRGPADDRPLVSLYWSLALDDHARWQADGLDAWKAEVRGFDPRIEPVLAQITDPTQVLLARYRDVRMKRWHGDRIVFLGDAAHATSPQLGNGANLALVDAWTLAEALAADRLRPTPTAAPPPLAVIDARAVRLGPGDFVLAHHDRVHDDHQLDQCVGLCACAIRHELTPPGSNLRAVPGVPRSASAPRILRRWRRTLPQSLHTP